MTLFTIFCMAVITFTTRYIFLHPKLPIKLSPKMISFLSFSAPAVLTAIWAPILFVKDHELALSFDNPYLIAGGAAIICAYRFRNIYLTLLISGALFILLKWYTG